MAKVDKNINKPTTQQQPSPKDNKMPPSASPVMSWAPILFPPWNSALLPAAFYPAALRSLPK